MALLLGDDGRGYELARKLESHGVWRSWLGDSHYSVFVHFLSSPSSWETFMRSDDKTRAQLQLQLRARALLFDKASISLFLRSNSSSAPLSSNSITKLNPNYLQLHGDDVYFTLDNSLQDAAQSVSSNSSSSPSRFHSKSTFSAGGRFCDSESDVPLRYKVDEFPETWYAQFFEKYKASKSYRVSFGDQETEKRTPEQMSVYLRVLEKHKRRRLAFREDQHMGFGSSILETGSNILSNVGDESSAADDEMLFFPETMFSMNCVPDKAVVGTSYMGDNSKVKFNGILDTLPQVFTKTPVISPIMIERLGIRPELLNMDQGGGHGRGANISGGTKKPLSEEQASQMSQKVIARFLFNMGFEASSEVPLEVLAQLLSCHISKLGRTLKVLTDSYRKQCSAIELLKMFLHTSGHSNLGVLSELVKNNTRSSVQQTHQQIHGIQSQLQLQQPASIRQSQQMVRQMHPQIQQMINPQSLTFQQQQHLERMRRRQQPTPRPGMSMNINANHSMNMNMSMSTNTNVNMNSDHQRPMVQVKIENPSDFPIDNNAFNSLTSRQAQAHQQFRQQQLAAMSSLHVQPSNQFRQAGSPQIPQIHSPNTGMVRAPPVKVEGFQELMGGDATLKHDSEENKLTSPSK